jgi:hypothetical protein
LTSLERIPNPLSGPRGPADAFRAALGGGWASRFFRPPTGPTAVTLARRSSFAKGSRSVRRSLDEFDGFVTSLAPCASGLRVAQSSDHAVFSDKTHPS